MTKKWKDTEQIAALFEKSLNPEYIVEHDVKLPVLTSKTSRTRQCDIVIWKGKHPRKTLIIVEVQDRNKQVEVNTFGGWLDKMKEVGAQHLYCVSRKPFPKSIIEKAKEIGIAVQLMVLEEIPLEKLPINFRGLTVGKTKIHEESIGVILRKVKSYSIQQLKVWEDFSDNLRILRNENLFKIEDYTDRVSLYKILATYMNSNLLKFQEEKTYDLQLNNIELLYKEHLFDVSVKYCFSITIENHPLTINCTTYSQQDEGELAWLVHGEMILDGKEISGKIPILKSENGEYFIDFKNSVFSDWVVATTFTRISF